MNDRQPETRAERAQRERDERRRRPAPTGPIPGRTAETRPEVTRHASQR